VKRRVIFWGVSPFVYNLKSDASKKGASLLCFPSSPYFFLDRDDERGMILLVQEAILENGIILLIKGCDVI